MFTVLAVISNQLSHIGCYSEMFSPSALGCHFLLLEYVTPKPTNYRNVFNKAQFKY